MEQLSYLNESVARNEEEWTLTHQQRESLLAAEQGFMDERREDGDARWHRFFDAGIRDERGAIWALYNDIWHEECSDGWQLWCCPVGQETFDRVAIDEVVRTDLSRWCSGGKGCLATIQLGIGSDTNRNLGMVQNDRLNILFYQAEVGSTLPKLRFWNHQHDMEPVPVLPAQLLGERAVGQLVSAPVIAVAA